MRSGVSWVYFLPRVAVARWVRVDRQPVSEGVSAVWGPGLMSGVGGSPLLGTWCLALTETSLAVSTGNRQHQKRVRTEATLRSLTWCHFRHIIFVRACHRASPLSRDGRIDLTALQEDRKSVRCHF